MGLAVGPLLLVWAIFAWQSFRILQHQALDHQQEIAKRVSSQVTAFFEEIENELRVVGQVQGLLTRDRNKQKSTLLGLLSYHSVFDELILLDAKGREQIHLARSRVTPRLGRRSNADEFIIPRTKGEAYYSPVRFDETTGEPSMTISIPLFDARTGLVDGALVSEVRMKKIWNLIADLRMDRDQSVYIVDAQDRIVAHRNPSVVLRGATFDVPDQGGIHSGLSGTSAVLASEMVRLGQRELNIVSEQSLPGALAVAASMMYVMAAVLIGAFIIAGALGFLIVRQIVGPIQSMAVTAQAISAGDLSQQVEITSRDELGALAISFNSMTSQLIRMLGEEKERARELHREVVRRKETEKALRESEERLDFALSAANEGIWDWYLDSDTLVFDDRYYTMAGYEPEEFPGAFEEWEKRVHPDDIEQTKTAFGQYLAGEMEIFDAEFRFMHKEGRYMWIRGQGKIVTRNEQGEPTRFIGTHSDITEQKQIEESLRITQFSFDKAAVGIYRIGSDAKILEVNDKAARILGYTKEELSAMSIFDIDPLVNSEAWGAIWQTLAEQGQYAFETVHRGKDGGEIPVEIHSNLLEYDGLQYSIAFAQDITERKRADEELLRLRNYLANIIDSMPSALVGVDKNGNVTQWNKTVEQATGINADAARGKSISHLMPWMASETGKITDSIRTRQIIQGQKRPRVLEGDIRYEDITIYPLITNGVEGAVIRIDDVTEKVRLEEMMIQSEKMLSVGGLAAGMAHEINNPLAGIMQTAAVMAGRLGDNLHIPANRKAAEAAGTTLEAIESFMAARGIPRMLDTINESGKRMAAIVGNMLSFARKSDATVSSHVLDQLLDKTLELAATDYDLKKQYDFKRIEIHRDYADDIPTVPCEGAKIQQVLLNILRNGAQAMQEADTESPRFMVRTRFEKERNMVRMEIEDNGPGMDEATRKRMFEPFFTTKPTGVGTGLGLSVSYFIITENHRGEMTVESRPGTGTKFVIRLPMKEK